MAGVIVWLAGGIGILVQRPDPTTWNIIIGQLWAIQRLGPYKVRPSAGLLGSMRAYNRLPRLHRPRSLVGNCIWGGPLGSYALMLKRYGYQAYPRCPSVIS